MPRISRRTIGLPSRPSQAVDYDAPTQRRAETADADSDVDMEASQDGSGSVEQLSRSLVRYALSCEYARKPIKRQDVNERVLGSHARMFKTVFEQANSELMDVFGMAMAELPKGERVTARQKRAAAPDAPGKSSNMWVLQTIVPAQYRLPEVIGPSRALETNDGNHADAYVGLYTMVIALITIAGGRLPEAKLDRALRRMNAEQTTPVDTKDKTLALMSKDGYIVKVRESSNGDESVDYIVGPRGKLEVGREGFAALVRMLYGNDADEEDEALEKKIKRTLDMAGSHERGGGAQPKAREGGRR
ncbi:MAGE-domain-containing protein [Lizonia empirigonia]|nr:MAGE-domain-containing protein [Lizonia empirigonia]